MSRPLRIFALFLMLFPALTRECELPERPATFFTVFKSYCTLNARIQKRFGKVNVFIQGRDLLDNTLEREYTSSDFNETWVESIRNNRRLLMLGMNYGL